MMKILPIAAVAVSLLSLSCQQQGQHDSNTDTPAENIQPPMHLGAVHQVYPEQGFALLRIIGPIPAPGTVLITHPADGSNSRIGNLVVTADKPASNRIIAAEHRSGSIMKGDRVFLYRNINAPEAKPEEDSAEETPNSISPQPSQPTTTTAIPAPVMPQTAPTHLPKTTDPVVTETPRPTQPEKPTEVPQHIYDIPDNFDDWD